MTDTEMTLIGVWLCVALLLAPYLNRAMHILQCPRCRENFKRWLTDRNSHE